jgi:hypothetical protein
MVYACYYTDMFKDLMKESRDKKSGLENEVNQSQIEKQLTLIVSIRVWEESKSLVSKYVYEFSKENKHMKVCKEQDGCVRVLINVGYNDVQKKGLFIPAGGLIIPPEGIKITI